ncbi:hypothetical protein, partial [Piscibacillus halophilus]
MNSKKNSLISIKPNKLTMSIYQSWLSNVPKDLMTYFEDNNWEEDIFNYFTYPITIKNKSPEIPYYKDFRAFKYCAIQSNF